MRVRVLGTTEVVRDGAPVDLGGRKQRTLLAALALARGRPVSVDALLELLWPDGAPASAVPTLQVYLAGVRRALEPDRAPRTPPRVVVTVAPGYALRLPDEDLDVARFDAAVGAAHRALGGADRPAGDLAAWVARLDAALADWRGDPFTDLGDADVAVAERARLAELRLVALEDRAAARLALGEHGTVAAELEALTAEHPLRERLWRLRVRALAGTGRSADALGVLRHVRRVLAEELGLDPGPELRELETAVLRQDPDLFRPAATTGATPTSDPDPAPAAGPAPAAPAPAAPGDWPLAGRSAEIGALAALLDGDGPAFAVLVGEPGIGKSRLARELAAGAAARGHAVLAGRCSDDEGAPPMWPWSQVLRDLVAAVPADALDAGDLAACADLIAPRPATAPAAAEPAARFRQWEAVTRLLSAAAAVRPLLVVLDDLHWADASSLLLLAHIAGAAPAGPVTLLATRRAHPEPTGPLAAASEALGRRHALRLDLAGLSTEDTAALVESATGRRPVPADAAALRERTDGNPFFLVELARLPAATDAVPSAVQEVVARRVERLPEPTRELLRTAAVIGREFDLAVLATAAGRDEDAVLDDLDPALAAGVVAEAARVDRFRFAHAVVREVVHDGQPAARRARRHAAVAAALDAPSETAWHWLAAGPRHADRAWRAAAAAAAGARAIHAHEEAADLLAAAVRAQAGDPAASPVERYDLFMARADACRLLADRDGVDAAVAGAIAEAERLDDVERLGRAAVATTEGALSHIRLYGQSDERMIGVLRRVLRELSTQDSELRCRVLLVLGSELYYTDSPAYLEALIEQGMAMARRLDDPGLLAWACQTSYMALWRAENAEYRWALANEGVAAAARLGDPAWEALARTTLAIVAGETGRVDVLNAELPAARAGAERMRLRYLLLVLAYLDGPWLAMRGRFAEAEDLAQRHPAPDATGWDLIYQMAAASLWLCIRIWQGRGAEMLPMFRAFQAGGAPISLNFQWLLARTGRLDEARAAHEEFGMAPPKDDWLGVFERCQAVEVGYALGRPDLAAAPYAWLRPYAGRVCSAGWAAAVGPVDAFLALGAAATGDRAAATRHADDALALCTAWDLPLVADWLRGQREAGGF